MIRRLSQQGGSAHSRGNPAIHTGYCGNDPGIPVVCLSLALGAVHQNLTCTSCSAEAPFVDEELADAAELSVVVPEFGSALYPVLPLCVNQPL
jgi:hypothetical protein